MNRLCEIFENIASDSKIVLENREYHVYPEDSFCLKGYFCTNSAKVHENPLGLRHTAIYLKNKKNITLDGNGAKITVHGKMTPLLFDRCENITVKNLTVDYARPTMTEFKVLSNENGVCDIGLNPDCLFEIQGNRLFFCGENGADGKPYWKHPCRGQGIFVKVFDPKTLESRDFDRELLAFDKIEILDPTTLRLYFENRAAAPAPGLIFQIRSIVRDQVGSLFDRCRNLKFENLRICFMHGLGLVSQFCENISFSNCDLTPAPGRTIASTADFFQFSGCKGLIRLDKCCARGAHDDYVNIHGTHLRIMEENRDENRMILRFMHPETWGLQAFEAGDELEFIKWNNLQPYAAAKVRSHRRLDNTDIELVLDRPLPQIEIGRDVVENITCTPEVHISNCDFGPTSGRGILATTRKAVLIESCRFEKLNGPALLIEDDCNFWFESGCTENLRFENNEVIACDYQKTTPGAPAIRVTPKIMDESFSGFVHRSLKISGNRFSHPAESAHSFHLEYLENAIIEKNTFDCEYKIHTRNVGSLTDRDNTVE